MFVETEFFDTQLRQWLGLPILLGLGYALGVLVTSLWLRLLRRRHSELPRAVNRFVVGPVRLLVLLRFFSLARRSLSFSLTARPHTQCPGGDPADLRAHMGNSART